jgi:MFS family permease
VALFAFLLLRGEGFPVYAVGYFMLGGFRAARMLAMAQVRWLVDQAQMGLAYGISETFSSLAMILAPLLAGALYEKDPLSIFILALILIGLSVVVTIIFAPRPPSSTVP